MSSFKETKCVNCIFQNCTMYECNFEGAILNGTSFENSYLVGADFRNAKVVKLHFRECNLENAKICAYQLKDLTDFDLPLIKRNKIRVYKNGEELPYSLIEEEIREQRPVEFAFYKFSLEKNKLFLN